MTDPTFEALLNHYQERGKRILDLEELCRDIYADLVDISEQDIEAAPAFKQVAERHQAAMKSLGLLEEE